MANVRATGKQLVGLWAEESFVRKIDEARGFVSRSDFFREALANLLQKNGIPVAEFERHARDRTGKGGRPRNHSPNSGPVSDVEAVAIETQDDAERLALESLRESEAGAPTGHKSRPKRGTGGHSTAPRVAAKPAPKAPAS